MMFQKYSLLLIIVFICSFQYTFAQMQAAHWIFGKNVHIEYPFGPDPLRLHNDLYNFNIMETETEEGSSTISDVNGNLLLYSNGNDIYNKFHEKMNSDFILEGNFEATQSSIIIPFPTKYNQYILFTINNYNSLIPSDTEFVKNTNLGLNYYFINLNKNNGHGEIIKPQKNNLLLQTSEKVHATFHSNGVDIWIMTHYKNKFYAYLVTKDGVQSPIISETKYFSDPRGYASNAKGYLKFSPNGSKVAIAHQNNIIIENLEIFHPEILMDPIAYFSFVNTNPDYPGNFFLYDFNNSTGKISNEYDFNFPVIFYGFDFSPSSKNLYFQYSNKHTSLVLQLDTETYEYKKINSIDVNIENDPKKIGALQLGLNGKIYHSLKIKDLKQISTINYPELDANNADYQMFNQPINKGNLGFGLPNFLSNYLKEELKVLNSFDGTNACLGTPLKFWVNNNQTITSIHWDFGDGEFSNEIVPEHTYKLSGTYNVKCTINGTLYTKTIIIHSPINLPTYDMIECDADGDGTTGFDLQNFIDYIGPRAAYITFHHSKNEALSNLNPIEENKYKFQGNSSLNSIWARIIGAGGCITFTEINFKINTSSVIPKTETLCKSLTNNQYYISLKSLEELIGIGNIMVFNNLSDADLLLNQITEDILIDENLNSINLFIRKRNFEDCDDIIELRLNLLNPTIINLPKISALCPFDGSLTFNVENKDITSINWKNEAGEIIQTTNTITISKEGKYSVTVINKNNCPTTEYFEIIRSSPIEITYIIDKSQSLIINYGLLDSNNYLFSIDQGITWHNGTTFANLPLGSYELWIKENNKNGCIVYNSTIKNNIITNFFSPNGDGKNDKWTINGFEKYEWIDIQIYNRYGKLILKNRINTSNIIWDGKINGLTQPNESYWYILKTSKNEQYEGYVTLKTK